MFKISTLVLVFAMVLGTEALFGSANFAVLVASELRCHSLCVQRNGGLDDAGEGEAVSPSNGAATLPVCCDVDGSK